LWCGFISSFRTLAKEICPAISEQLQPISGSFPTTGIVYCHINTCILVKGHLKSSMEKVKKV
jgi:hypothetical protein